MLDIDKVLVDPLDLYREAFKNALETKSDCRFTNSSLSHAIVIIEELINHSNKTLDIYCHALSSDVWCEKSILDAINLALSRGVAFRVIVQEKTSEDNKAVELFIKNNILIRLDTTELAENIRVPFNFVIADHTSFRYEPDSSKREGCAYAMNKEFSDIINQTFDMLYEHSQQRDGAQCL